MKLTIDRWALEPKQYGIIGGEVCRIRPNDDGNHFCLVPVDGKQAHVCMLEGQFHRCTETENESLRRMHIEIALGRANEIMAAANREICRIVKEQKI